MRRETQDGFRQRLRQEGRFKEFSALRKDLQAEGLSPSDSWNRAAAEFGFGEPQAPDEGAFSGCTSSTAWFSYTHSKTDRTGARGPFRAQWSLLDLNRMAPVTCLSMIRDRSKWEPTRSS